ncbi:MAG: 30S ribosomal protein S14 [Rickettsiales bacterium]|nr:MAG: 30S ribosomal protein S14 [Rickettsiales bacterium]
MAKTGSVERNNKRKKMAKSFENKRKALSAKIYDKNISLEERFNLVVKLAELPRNSAKSRIKNRCVVTGRPRGVNRKMNISRNVLRELAAKGMIPGLVRASW